MPVVKSITDLQRNFGSLADSCHKTKEPVYLTKNGSDASLELSPLPPCNHPVNHSGALEFYRDAVAPGAPLC